MNIISNYNLSIYPKTNKQQSKTNPNFGISTKNLTLPLGITAAGIGAAVQEAMKVDAPTVLGMYGNPDSKEIVSRIINSTAEVNVSEQIDLPADENGYTNLHHWCKNGNFEEVKKFLDENPDINLSQKTNDGYTCMSIAAINGHKDITKLIAGMDNYNPFIKNKDSEDDLMYLAEYGCTEAVDILVKKNIGESCIPRFNSMTYGIPNKFGLGDYHHLSRDSYPDGQIKILLEKQNKQN